MKSDNLTRNAVFVFALALALYIVAYSGIEARRTHRGPWQIAFTNDAAGTPQLLINQPALGITNVQIAFPGKTLPPRTNSFAIHPLTEPQPVPFPVPFGQCVFQDATSLPGTLAFELFGHEIQLLPRVLTLDKVEQPWRSGAQLVLPTTSVR
jgi:hypothetical protein